MKSETGPEQSETSARCLLAARSSAPVSLSKTRRLLKRRLAGTARPQFSRRSASSSEIRALCRGSQQILSTPEALELNRTFLDDFARSAHAYWCDETAHGVRLA
eukprot:2401021-Prymnesium_polylepis.1